MPRFNDSDQASLFGYISPVTGDVCVHPPLCACGTCPMPVERFHRVAKAATDSWPQPAVTLIESTPEAWEADHAAR